MADHIDPYGLFGLNENYANIATARKAYYALALDTHPDKQNGDDSQFKIVHSAWKFVEQQLRGVPDAGDVVARFEAHRDEWKAFVDAQGGDLPTLREVTDECSPYVASTPATTAAIDAFRARWDAQPRGDVWASFPEGGYDAPRGNTSTASTAPFPPRELVVYEAPNPSRDRFSCRAGHPLGIQEPIEDMSVDDGALAGCDYRIAMSEAPSLGEDPRVGRTLVALEAERAGLGDAPKAKKFPPPRSVREAWKGFYGEAEPGRP
jgi:hypothetical protein